MSIIKIENLCGTQHRFKSAIIKSLLENERDILLNGQLGNAICFDGIVDEQTYDQQRYRLAFLLKETNGNTSDGTAPDHYDDWDYAGWIRDKQSTGAEPLYPTFRNIAMWAAVFYDIFEHGSTDKENYLHNGVLKVTDSLKSTLRRIAVINLKKTFGGGTTDWRDLNAYLTQDVCDVIREEIFTAEPTIVLCGGRQVFDFVGRLHRSEGIAPLTVTTSSGITVEYIPTADFLYVNFFHPACRKSREAMFDYAAEVFAALKNL